ncbi:NYN domain-containing protein [Hymenobacter lucidus]|uniref:NYN domain-containing protein n=1 Tax=Hymenobacter lucidus TaxID=2880930 RepID=A0ABS8ARP2_9BACT|nr:NYN domain-containing protein [Hymenobacter lucidus]MCB2408907.1 NYN domain-containing protein [Hymenobacter lucidus]
MEYSQPTTYGTILVDYENFYYYFKNNYPSLPDPQECVLEAIRGLREYLRKELKIEPIILNAYADFERIGPAAQLGDLYLLGANTRNVLGTQHKNAADMQLCIDALEVLYTRSDIQTFVFMAGDRDYIPVIQHLRRQARRVVVVGFRDSTSGGTYSRLSERIASSIRSCYSRRRAGKP